MSCLKKFYNETNYLVRQAFFNEKKWLRTFHLRQEISTSLNFQQLPVKTAEKILQLVDKAWKSFFVASADWKLHPKKYLQQPRIPKYKLKNGQFQLAFCKKQVTFSNGMLLLPQITGVQVKTRLSSSASLIGVRIIPKGIGYVLEIIYSKNVPYIYKNINFITRLMSNFNSIVFLNLAE